MSAHAPSHPAALFFAAIFLSAVLLTAALAPPAMAQVVTSTPPATQPTTEPIPLERVKELATADSRLSRQRQELLAERDQLRDDHHLTTSQLAPQRAKVDELNRAARAIAQEAYIAGPSFGFELAEGLLGTDPNQSATSLVLTEAAIEEILDRAADARDEMADLDARLEHLTERLAIVDGRLVSVTDAHHLARTDLLTAVAAHEAGRGMDPVDARYLIRSEPIMTAAEMASVVRSAGNRWSVSVSPEELAQIYIEEGARYGVRADIAWVQSIIETGWFSFPAGGQLTGDNFNFAGIGACDSCPVGYGYTSARDGVRAQMQLLRIYADAEFSPAAITAIGDVPAFDGAFRLGWRGGVVTWDQLAGRWASATHYGVTITNLYHRLLTQTGHRAAVVP